MIVGEGLFWALHRVALDVLRVLLDVLSRLLVHVGAGDPGVLGGPAAKAALLVALLKEFLVQLVHSLKAALAVLQIADRAAEYQLGVVHLEHFF